MNMKYYERWRGGEAKGRRGIKGKQADRQTETERETDRKRQRHRDTDTDTKTGI